MEEKIVDRYEIQQLVTELLEWTWQAYTKMGTNEQYLINHTGEDIKLCKIPMMCETTKLLIKEAKNY